MESNKSISKQNLGETVSSNFINGDELANLKKVTDIDNNIQCEFGDLIICTANELHVKEIAELWANLACVQQISAPQRYDFVSEGKDWQSFVRRKLSKKNNLLLVAHNKGIAEIKGFLYLQTVTIPSSDLILKGIIEDIYTKPQYRKQGIAVKMLDVSLEWALKQNIKQIDLISPATTNDLTALYARLLKQNKKNINLELLSI
ncbi:MAG: GNAT family N-acetyltransferase [Candidatus Melainabacteria bacterium]|nr:GNAT family N-acetyltransferase [Candidatus Melainabacteria bacterium]